MQWVNGVIVDYADSESVIYWVDAGPGVVGRADLDGRNQKLSKKITNSHLVAITLHNGTVYLSDNRAKKFGWWTKQTLNLLEISTCLSLKYMELPYQTDQGNL